jgi:hypothetical protein
LGYYADGVKRTLTDEQIAMFRHSEIQTLLRERRRAEDDIQPTSRSLSSSGKTIDPVLATEDTEIDNDFDVACDLAPKSSAPSKDRRGRRAQPSRVRGKPGFYKQAIKPDLRKRTWDKVEKGVESLYYGEDEEIAAKDTKSVPQRRKISYDD